jgi:hypothetical protein
MPPNIQVPPQCSYTFRPVFKSYYSIFIQIAQYPSPTSVFLYLSPNIQFMLQYFCTYRPLSTFHYSTPIHVIQYPRPRTVFLYLFSNTHVPLRHFLTGLINILSNIKCIFSKVSVFSVLPFYRLLSPILSQIFPALCQIFALETC